MMIVRTFTAALMAGTCLCTLPGSVFAQTVRADDASAAEGEAIVVTGSRVITNGDDSPTPITVNTAADLATVRPGNVADSLYLVPAFTQTRNQTTNPGAGGGSANSSAANNAINTVNLRGLGSSRTLVLYNGRRMPAVSPDGWPDINLVSPLLLARVETVTGGASAVYGSDAIGGVVNFVSDRKFTGLKGEFRLGRSTYDDGDTAAAGLAWGGNFADGRGHLMASYNYSWDDGVDSRRARPWGLRRPTRQGNGTTIPFTMVLDALQNNQTFGGVVNSVAVTGSAGLFPLAGKQFVSPGGTPVNFDPGLRGTAAGLTNGGYQLGGDGSYQDSTLRSKLELHQAAARLDYELTDAVSFFFDASAVWSKSSQIIGYNTLASNTGFSGRNAFLAADYQFDGTFTLGKFIQQLPQSTRSNVDEAFFLGGLEGELAGGYRWALSATRGSGTQTTRMINYYDNQKLAAALDAVKVNGQVVCYAATQAATAAAYAGCVPLNPFGVNSESGAALDYVTDDISVDVKTVTSGAAAEISGSPLEGWAGPINVALSAEWRRSEYQADSTSVPVAFGGGANCTNIRTFGGTQCGGNTNRYQYAVADRTPVSQTVYEAAIEAGIPLMRDGALGKGLDLNLAARYAAYHNRGSNGGVGANSAFDALTWKAGLVWDISDELTVRVSHSRDFRAPNLDELYRPLTVGLEVNPIGQQIGGKYVLPVVAGGARTESGGNVSMKPEIAHSTTLGIVFRPTNNISFALDGFQFKIKDAANFLLGSQANVVVPCVDNPSLPICYFLERNAAGAVTVVRQGFLNAAILETYGLDFESNFQTSIAGRPFSLRALMTWQPRFRYDVLGTITDEAGVASSFGQQAVGAKVRANLFVNFKPTDHLQISVHERWRSPLRLTNVPAQASADVPSVAYTNVNFTWTPAFADEKVHIFFNVQNLFNKEPPPSHPGSPVAPGFFGGAAPDDDVMGRYFTAGARFRF